ncbi:hypothetical protein [Methylotuvimicrobium sp.]|uniref:hypothetical protein n=1 Tax=Methylotuvimicrobium sp. TaxID=2822413 RepID=UPI003D645F46
MDAYSADVDNFDPPELIDAPEKILFFQTMLQKLEDEYGWKIEYQMGDVPKSTVAVSIWLVTGLADIATR